MGKYVDADKVIDVMKAAYWDENMHSAKDDPCVIDAMIDWSIRQVKDAPTEDVKPVIHAHWERHFKRPGVYEDLWWHCSNCNGRTSEEYAPYWGSYCPYCGARMDGEVNDA